MNQNLKAKLPEEAAKVYNEKSVEFFGEFAHDRK